MRSNIAFSFVLTWYEIRVRPHNAASWEKPAIAYRFAQDGKPQFL
jgi:hypothetical protein